MDPILAMQDSTMYAPSYGSLPQIASTTDLLTMPMLQAYANQVSGLDDYSRAMNTCDSVFMGYPGGYNVNGNIDYDAYYANMAANQARMSAYNMAQQQRFREESLIANAPMERINKAASTLQEKIVGSEQDQIPAALAAFVNAVRDAYDPNGVADDEQILAKAMTIYQQMTGKSLTADIRENGRPEFLQGLYNGLTFGLCARGRTAEDNIADINGQPKGQKAKDWNTAGSITGSTAAGAGVGAAIGACFGGVGAGPGALIGAGVGLVVGVIRNIF